PTSPAASRPGGGVGRADRWFGRRVVRDAPGSAPARTKAMETHRERGYAVLQRNVVCRTLAFLPAALQAGCGHLRAAKWFRVGPHITQHEESASRQARPKEQANASDAIFAFSPAGAGLLPSTPSHAMDHNYNSGVC